jgi:hypothetical protein
MISVSLKSGEQTIHEASEVLYRIMKNLSMIDSFFLRPLLRQEKFQDVEIDLSAEKDEVIKLIDNTIIEFSKGDILKYEKEINPTCDYSRDFFYAAVGVVGRHTCGN